MKYTDTEIFTQIKQIILNQHSIFHTRQSFPNNQQIEFHIVFNFYNGISSSTFTQIYFTSGTSKVQNILPKTVHMDRFLSENMVNELIQLFIDREQIIDNIWKTKQEFTLCFHSNKETLYKSKMATVFLHCDFYGCANTEELMERYFQSIIHQYRYEVEQTKNFQKIKSQAF